MLLFDTILEYNLLIPHRLIAWITYFAQNKIDYMWLKGDINIHAGCSQSAAAFDCYVYLFLYKLAAAD